MGKMLTGFGIIIGAIGAAISLYSWKMDNQIWIGFGLLIVFIGAVFAVGGLITGDGYGNKNIVGFFIALIVIAFSMGQGLKIWSENSRRIIDENRIDTLGNKE